MKKQLAEEKLLQEEGLSKLNPKSRRSGQTKRTGRSSISKRGRLFNDEDDPIAGIPKEEVDLIKAFLQQFVLASEHGSKTDQIDVKLALKALPSKVDEENVYRC